MQHLDLSFPLSSRDFKIQQQRERKSYSKSIKREALEDRGEARDARVSGRERERKFGKEREREREREEEKEIGEGRMAVTVSGCKTKREVSRGKVARRCAGGRRERRAAVAVRAKVHEVFMPALSSTMTEGTVVEWLKSEGDAVAKGESLLVVASDKADMVVESFNDGIVGSIAVQAGESASVGSAIAFLAESEEDLEAARVAGNGSGGGGGAANAAPAAPPSEEKVEPRAEQSNVGMRGVEGEAAVPVAAASEAPPPPPPPAPPAENKSLTGRLIATPYAKKLAKKHKIDLANVTPTGPHGRIVAADIELAAGIATAAPAAAAPVAPAAAAAPAAVTAPAPAKAAPAAPEGFALKAGKTEPFSTMQAAVSRNMVESLAVPEFRACMTIVTDKFDALYRSIKPSGVTMSAMISKAVAIALRSHPVMYASCTGDGIRWNEEINIASAVAMDGGLITPVLKSADKTDIYQLSREWRDLVKRARAKKLAPDEFTTGTFTISNLGMMGVDAFDAILPPGQAGILAVGTSKKVVFADDETGFIGTRTEMKVNLTADHRIVYGMDAAEFLKTLKSVMEDPDVLLL